MNILAAFFTAVIILPAACAVFSLVTALVVATVIVCVVGVKCK